MDFQTKNVQAETDLEVKAIDDKQAEMSPTAVITFTKSKSLQDYFEAQER